MNLFRFSYLWVCAFGALIGLSLFIFSFRTQLNGPHGHRQADSIAPGYYFCTEPDSQFLLPKIGPRANTPGVAINEFPVYSFVLGKICQLKGSWDEITPRVLSLVFALFAGIFFLSSLRLNLNLTRSDRAVWIEFLSIFIFLPVCWTFFSIPMPESTALLFYSMAALCWSKIASGSSYKFLLHSLAALFFLIGFLVRPFYILLLFLFAPSLFVALSVLAGSVFLFWLWYRYWNSQVTSVHGYFGIQTQTLIEILHSLPQALRVLPLRIFEHTAGIGLWPILSVWRKYPRLILLYVLTLGMMYTLKSTHIPDHSYYLLNAGILAAFLIFLGLQEMSTKSKLLFFSLFFGIVFAHTQHNFHGNGNWNHIQEALRTYEAKYPEGLDKKAHVATFLGSNPHWLYMLKRTGFIFNRDEFNNTCPSGATHYLIYNPEVIHPDVVRPQAPGFGATQSLILEKCASIPN